MADEIIVETTSQEIVEVGVIGPQGPQGPKGDPGDVAGLPLSTQGDTLYRGASQNERLPIGQNSQVLKVVNGLPAWANESGAVASVNGETGAVVLDGSEIDTSGNSASAAFIATSFADGDGIYYPLPDSFINTKPVYRTTSAHHVFFENSRWHITDGPPVTVNIIESSDNDNAAWPWLSAWSGDVTKAKLSDVVGRARDTFLFVGDSIPNTSVSGLASVASSGDYNDLTGKPASFTPSSHASTHHTGGTDAIAPDQIGAQSIFSNQTLTLTSNTTLSAARAVIYTVVSNGTITITLPTSGHKVGDIVVIRSSSLTGSLSVTWGAGGQSIALSTQYRFIATGTGATNWSLVNVDTHTHPSTQITGLGTAATQDSTAFAPATGISPSAITGTAVVDSDARLSDSRTPSSHSSSHASSGSDPLFDQDLNTTDYPTFLGIQLSGGDVTWGLNNILSGFGNSIDFENGIIDSFGMNAQADAFRIQDESDPTKEARFNAGGITTGTLRQYTLPNEDGTLALAGNAPASHTHGNLTNDGKLGSTAGLPVVTTTAGAVSTLALGAAGTVLTVNSGATGVEFAAASGGVTGAAASASDVLGVSGANITGVDANADRLIFFDDSAGKLTHLTLGSNALTIDGTTLKSQPLFPVEPVSRGATYIPYIGSGSNGNSSNAVNTGGGFVLFAPVYVRKSANYTTFSIIVSGAGSASSLGKMALYTIKAADALPDALVCESGTFTTDSTGLKQPTMASTFVSEGWYYMGIGTNSTTNMTFFGDTMLILRGVFSGAALNTNSVLLDYSQKLYANLWPNPWDGTNNTFRNAFHPITSLS